MASRVDIQEAYQAADQRKRICLQKLMQAGVRIRGGLYHWKSYLSEKAAYLGSCNLTGGSLNRNHEGGIVWQGTDEHRQLLGYFTQYWHAHSTKEALPTPLGMRIKSLPWVKSPSFDKTTNFLSPRQYANDLLTELQKFAHNPQGRISIYTRNFRPNEQMRELLSRLNHQIWVGLPPQGKALQDLQIRHRDNLHTKITLLGTEVVYIGGINFDFSSEAFSLMDLVYKTTDTHTIQGIRQSLKGDNLS